MTDIDLELLTNARYMSLMSAPASPQAKAFVEDNNHLLPSISTTWPY